MIIELRDRVAALGVQPDETVGTEPQPPVERWREQVSTGLQGLGWSAKDAELAVENVADLVTADPQISLGRLMKAALQSLARA